MAHEGSDNDRHEQANKQAHTYMQPQWEQQQWHQHQQQEYSAQPSGHKQAQTSWDEHEQVSKQRRTGGVNVDEGG